jgi:hypothetical protein
MADSLYIANQIYGQTFFQYLLLIQYRVRG